MLERGEQIHGEFYTAAGTGGEITLYDQRGNARVLAATEILVVSDVIASTDTAGLLTVYFDKDDDNAVDNGERIVVVPAAANGGVAHNFSVPRYGPQGAKPHILASASGEVACTLSGFILKA